MTAAAAASAPHWRPAPHLAAAAGCRTLPLSGWSLALSAVPQAPPVPGTSWPQARCRAHRAGRLCALRALGTVGSAASGTEALPALGRRPDGAPIWPPGWTGSITHDPHQASAVVAPRRFYLALGIDSEPVMSPAAAHDLAQVCCTPGERCRWPAGRDPHLTTLLFSAKEAFYKAVAPLVERFIDFDEVELVRLDPIRRTGELNAVPGVTWPERFRRAPFGWREDRSGLHVIVLLPA